MIEEFVAEKDDSLSVFEFDFGRVGDGHGSHEKTKQQKSPNQFILRVDLSLTVLPEVGGRVEREPDFP